MVAIAAAWARNGRIDTRVRTFNFVGGREMVQVSGVAGGARHGAGGG